MKRAEYEEEIALLARELAGRGETTLRWSAGPLSESMPWAEGWADIYIEELCKPLGDNWLATVVLPGEEAGSYDCLVVAPDA